MSRFDRYTLRVFGRELRQQNVQCVDLTDQRLGFWQGVAATKCSMSRFDRYPLGVFGRELRQQNVQCLSTKRVLAGSCG